MNRGLGIEGEEKDNTSVINWLFLDETIVCYDVLTPLIVCDHVLVEHQ